MKKLCITFMAILFSATGCTQIVEEYKIAKETFYSELSYLMSYPEELEEYLQQGYIEENVDFIAKVSSEIVTMDFGENNGGSQKYMHVVISREEEDTILVNVSRIKQTFAIGDTINIQGKFNGYLYEIIDNEKVNILDVEAEQIKQITPKTCTTTNTQFKIDNTQEKGLYEFKRATITSGTFNNVIVLYFDYTNLGDTNQYADIDYFKFRQDESTLELNIFDVEAELGADVLKYEPWIEVAPGKTASYYAVLSLEDVTIPVSEAPLKVLHIDDAYNCVNEFVFNLSE